MARYSDRTIRTAMLQQSDSVWFRGAGNDRDQLAALVVPEEYVPCFAVATGCEQAGGQVNVRLMHVKRSFAHWAFHRRSREWTAVVRKKTHVVSTRL